MPPRRNSTTGCTTPEPRRDSSAVCMRGPDGTRSVGTAGASYEARPDGTFLVAHEHVSALLAAGFAVVEE